MEYFDMIIRMVDGCGYLPIIKNEDGKEIYRGEFQSSAELALVKLQAFPAGESK